MLSTVLVLGYGETKYRTVSQPGTPDPIACVYIDDDFRIQSSRPQALLDLAKALTDAAELLVREPVTT